MTAAQPVNPLTADYCCAIDDVIVNEMSASGDHRESCAAFKSPSGCHCDPNSCTIEFNAKLGFGIGPSSLREAGGISRTWRRSAINMPCAHSVPQQVRNRAACEYRNESHYLLL